MTSKGLFAVMMHAATLLTLYFFQVSCQFQYNMPFPMQMGAPANMMNSAIPYQQMQMMPSPQMMMPGMSMAPRSKMPVVVMPYYSKTTSSPKHGKKKSKVKKDKKKKKHRKFRNGKKYVFDSKSESSDETKEGLRTHNKKQRGKKMHQVLTPVVSYVTKDGYVVYQKKIKQEKAKDWLEVGRTKLPSNLLEEIPDASFPSRAKFSSPESSSESDDSDDGGHDDDGVWRP